MLAVKLLFGQVALNVLVVQSFILWGMKLFCVRFSSLQLYMI
jgi:hypothetical protein